MSAYTTTKAIVGAVGAGVSALAANLTVDGKISLGGALIAAAFACGTYAGTYYASYKPK